MISTKNSQAQLKIQPQNYKGIEFINLSDLPMDEQLLIRKLQINYTETDNLNVPGSSDVDAQTSPELIAILINGKIIKNCIQYKEYLRWRQSDKMESIH